MKCRWKSRGPQGPGDFRPGLIRQGWKNWEYLTRREDDTDLLQISKLVTGQSNNDFIRKQLLTLLKMGQFVSWLQSGHYTVRLFPLVAVLVFVKQLRNVHQTREDSVTLLS